jgi:glycosyltransferase involved in cell wall biosynthesis
MKVLFISHSSVIPTYREKLRLLSQKKGLELTLLLPHRWPEAGQKAETQSQDASLEGFPIVSAKVLFEGKIKRHFYPSFSKQVESIKPDLIHVEEEPYSLVAWQAARAVRRLGIPLVFFTWENLLEKFPFPHQSIRRQVLKTAAHAIAGDLEAGRLLENAGYAKNRISIIPQYGVNPELFKKKNVRILSKKLGLGSFTAGYAGRLVPEKGIHHLLEAFTILRNKKANLLIIGNGPLRQPLEKQAFQLGISNQIRWVPAMSQTQIPDYLNCMDVLVLPSLTTKTWKEQFGRVLIEAQACEVPVIGSDSGAIPEVIGKAGLIFPEGNPPALRDRLKKIFASLSLRKSLGTKGRRQVLRHYTNSKIAGQIYGIYQKIQANENFILHEP